MDGGVGELGDELGELVVREHLVLHAQALLLLLDLVVVHVEHLLAVAQQPDEGHVAAAHARRHGSDRLAHLLLGAARRPRRPWARAPSRPPMPAGGPSAPLSRSAAAAKVGGGGGGGASAGSLAPSPSPRPPPRRPRRPRRPRPRLTPPSAAAAAPTWAAGSEAAGASTSGGSTARERRRPRRRNADDEPSSAAGAAPRTARRAAWRSCGPRRPGAAPTPRPWLGLELG